MVAAGEYIERVRTIMNSADADLQGSFLTGSEMPDISGLIAATFVPAWRRCVKVMPRIWFKNVSFSGQPRQAFLQAGTGYIELPDDFYLLTAFKMKGWKKAVGEASIEDALTASIQSNEYTRGSVVRPVCTVSVKITGTGISGADVSGGGYSEKRVLNYYSLPRGLPTHEVEEAVYVPIHNSIQGLSDVHVLDINAQVLDTLSFLSAAMVFTILRKQDVAQTLEKMAVEMFPGI
jgi:hypothetical protein